MASVDSSTTNPNDPNNPNNAPGAVSQPGQTNQPATTSGAGGVTATGAGNVTGQVVGTANPSQPFQNISSYLAANAQGGQDLAKQVGSTVSQPITEAQTGITNAAQDFTKSVNSGYTPENKDLTAAVSSNPAYVVAENPENVANFQAQLNDKYTGPTDFAQTPGYSGLQSKIAAAQAQAANTQTESGIQSLLGSVEGPTTAGINKLDSLLLSADPANYKAIQDSGKGVENLLPTLNQTTADQNALAATGTTNASSAATAAAKALQDALSGETGNLANEQQTVQGIVNSYNNSVGIINPVTQSIAQDIQNFLAANPKLSLSDATSALAPLTNLQSLSMPTESTYASPVDYQTIQALAKLGLDPSSLSGLPISGDTANLAQTFQLPQELQNAIGQAPGVESALNSELNSLGGQITGAYAPFQALQQAENQRSSLVTQVGQANAQLKTLNSTYTQDQNALASMDQRTPPDQKKALQDKVAADKAQIDTLTGQRDTANNQLQAIYAKYGFNENYSGDISRQAQGLQWLEPASQGYNDLIAAINGQLGKLGSVGVPTINYGPNTVTDPVTGAPIGAPIGKDIGNAAALGTGAATAGAAAIPSLAAPSIASAITAGGSPAALDALGLSPVEAAGPAALAAYGTSNIVQNSLKNPVQSGLMTAANMGLSLATLSLPPAVFDSIGKAIGGVINSIGDFFGGLF